MYSQDTVEKIRKGYYSALYFNRTKQILLAEKDLRTVTMQVFQKNEDVVLCGIPEVIDILKIGTGYFEKEKWIDKFSTLKIEHLKEGTDLKPREPVMHITGPYAYFAHLESLYLGVLARQTLIATNARRTIKAAGDKPVVCFADRFDYFLNQELDGYAVSVGGITSVCTKAQTARWQGKIAGTIPHALIAMEKGNTLLAAEKFQNEIDDRLIVLVDFENDVIKTSLEIACKFGKALWGVRVDTSENMIDKSLKGNKDHLKGVNPTLIKLLRKKLDKEGFTHVKIIVSGGFNSEKITRFEKAKTPVNIYGVGSSLLKGDNDFTADIVKVDGKNLSKAGRFFKKIR